MREIKFRGKSIETGEWIYGYYVCTHDRHRIIYEDYEGFYCEEEVYPETIGEYISLKDKNDKEIYEGDIVKGFYDEYNTYFNETNRIEFISDVKWINNGFGVRRLTANYEGRLRDYGYQLFWDAENVEVIGNIYEDKHLLEGAFE